MVAALPRLHLFGMLDRKLLRDLLAMRAQALAIATVIAAGVCIQLLSSGLVTSLADTRQAFYERSAMADIWAPVVRAPLNLADLVQKLHGVRSAEPRLRFGIRIQTTAEGPQLHGEIISIPEDRESLVNRLHVTNGRMPSGYRSDEVVVLKKFADANRLSPGEKIDIIIRGRLVTVMITGLVHSAEHVYAIAPGEIVPDPSAFAVLWMNETPLAELTGWQGAFNELVLRVVDRKWEKPVIAELDHILYDYGTSGAYGRDEQLSDLFLSSEIDQLNTLGRVVPPVFLLVACLLVYAVVSRLVAVQRSIIGLLRAFGYSGIQIAFHFLKLAMLIGLAGAITGMVMGTWLGRLMADVYLRYYDFPVFLFRAASTDYLLSGIAALGGILLAGALGVSHLVSLQPAEAMVPEPPPDFSRGPGAIVSRMKWIDYQTRIIVRQIIRWPGRAFVTVFAIAASLSLMISVFVMKDAMNQMLESFFGQSGRYDAMVTFTQPAGRGAADELMRLPGVMYAEPFFVLPGRLRAGPFIEDVAVTGLSPGSELYRLMDVHGRPVRQPSGGILLSDDLAKRLAITTGDRVDLEITEAQRPRMVLPVVSVAPTWIGSAAHIDIDALRRMMSEADAVSGLYLLFDPLEAKSLKLELLEVPGIASVAYAAESEHRMRRLMQENIGISLTVFLLFAAMIAFGAAYNSIRISFSEREHEFASLRVLGFSRWDVSYILLGEVALLALLALMPGILSGYLLSVYFSGAMASELFRLPVVLERASVATVCGIIISVVALSAFIIRRKIDRIDMVKALKGA